MTAANVKLSVGTTISVSAGPTAAETAVGYEALTFTDIGEVINIGESGGNAQITPFTPVDSGVVNKRKGSIDYGTLALQIAKDAADAGQVILKAGFDGAARDTIHSFKIVDGSGDTFYFMGIISSFTTARGDANTIISHNCNVERTSVTIIDPA